MKHIKLYCLTVFVIICSSIMPAFAQIVGGSYGDPFAKEEGFMEKVASFLANLANIPGVIALMSLSVLVALFFTKDSPSAVDEVIRVSVFLTLIPVAFFLILKFTAYYITR